MSDADLDSMAELKDPHRLVKVIEECSIALCVAAQGRSTSS